MPGKLRRIVIAIFAAGAVVAGGYYLWAGRSSAQTTELTASGTIEATEINVSAQTAGRVISATVNEGDRMSAGQELIRLDDAALQAQRRQALAALAAARGTLSAAQANASAAQAHLAQLQAGPRAEEVAAEQQAVRAAAGRVTAATGQVAQARGALDAATAQRDQAVAAYANLKQGARPEQIEAAAVGYQQASAAVQQAQAAYDQVKGQPNIGMLPQSLALQQATLAQQAARANYEGLLAGASTPQLEQARAAVNQAVAGIVQASATVSQTEAALTTTHAELDAEQARLALLRAGSPAEEIKVAEAQAAAAQAQTQTAAGQLDAAQAALDAADNQIAQLKLAAPVSGVILSRAIEPGEMAQPGAVLLTIGDLNHLTLTVYIPEDQYGLVHLGDTARVAVDSFPGQAFAGRVQFIAEQAEFTPRNVQTAAGRRTTVFAVRLELENPDERLKPGMPADVTFDAVDVASGTAGR